MSQFLVKYKGAYGANTKIFKANNKREAMIQFNEKYKSYNYEIREVIDLSLPKEEPKEVKVEKEQQTSITLKEYRDIKESQKNNLDKMSEMLDETNEILFQQLKHFKDIDPSDEKKLGLEKAKNDSLSGLAKTLVQSTSIKAMIDNRKGLM